ncbi:hypothetical protein M5K25_009237 [Dendrobium thyrsiflorum]|uniref:Ysc84 actin-binding domain-containing protein n=1 Tax=Dendrobium thyrsiflorum TaxID=117978 RepID=A0ABD0VBU9_DENTH
MKPPNISTQLNIPAEEVLSVPHPFIPPPAPSATSLSMGELRSSKLPWIQNEILEHAWNEMAHTLIEASFGNTKEILDAKPPSWLDDSASMEYEIYKAANIVYNYNEVGMMVTNNVGIGFVIAHRDDGSWSLPSAISTFGFGWRAQAAGELTDFMIVLKIKDVIKNFSGNAHISLGAGISAVARIVGRAVEADLHAKDVEFVACYTYNRNKGRKGKGMTTLDPRENDFDLMY